MWWWKDPVDQTYYTYRTNDKLTTYQLMWFLENTNLTFDSNILQINAADLTKRLPVIRWNTLWILLEQNTNNPLQNIETGTINLRTYTWTIDMYLTPTIIKSATWTLSLYWTMEALSKNQNFDIPNKPCPKWFIPVPWNKDFWQPAFCVAKYEMSYSWITQTDTGWNTYSYIDNSSTRPALWKIVSAQWNSPIAEIKQPQAIEECNAMWDWYHLITNNQWMTIARNIEVQWWNWSSWNVWEWYIYNGISNSASFWCVWKWTNYLPSTTAWATVTWDSNCTGQKNKLILSNWEEIWDFAWNVWEHVNKTNDINSINWANWIMTNFTTIEGWVNWVDAWIDNMERSEYGPSVSTYDLINWIWRVNDKSRPDNLFIRGGAVNYADSGIFTLFLNYSINSQFRGTGFRCAKY